VVDIEPKGGDLYDAVFVEQNGVRYWTKSGLTDFQVAEWAAQYGARVVDIEGIDLPLGFRVYDVVFLNNSNELSTRVGEIMRGKTDGWVGAYLKRADGPVLGGFNHTRTFEPGGLLATLHHAHVMRMVRDGMTSLDAQISFYDGNPGESCPSNTNATSERLEQVLAGMMQAASNSRTRAITIRFGMGNIQGTAAQLGMTSTELNRHIGCPGTPNKLTLVDIGRLHEQVVGGWLGNRRETFYALMRNDYYGSGYAEGKVKDVLDQEKADLGLTDTQFQAFRSNLRIVGKKGDYGAGSTFHRAWGAYVQLPFYANGGIVLREYVTGAFVNDATNEAQAVEAAYLGASEILRDEIRAAMLSWRNHVFGSFTGFGSGCPGSAGEPWHAASGAPEIGEQVVFTLTGARPASPAVLMLGASNAQWNGVPLPLTLGFLGAPVCALLVAPDAMIHTLTARPAPPRDRCRCRSWKT